MPKRLSRRAEIILIKLKHLPKEAEHLIFPKGKAGVGEGWRGRERVTHSCFQKEGNTGASKQEKGTGLAAAGCCRAGVQRA